jgi:hypothetical protein
MAQTILTVEILTAALEGFEAQKKRVDAQIAEIKRALHGGGAVAAVSSETAKPKRKVSAAARKRMAAAQRKRWAAIKKKSAG